MQGTLEHFWVWEYKKTLWCPAGCLRVGKLIQKTDFNQICSISSNLLIRNKLLHRWYNPTNHFLTACLFIYYVLLSALAAKFVYFHNSFTTIKHSIPSFVFISVVLTGNLTGLMNANLFLMTCGQTRIQKQMWLTGMIGSHEGWNDLEVMSLLNPAQPPVSCSH